ncbi:MAG: MTAP family purine nucleoside phosphorylase [Bdellovibrionales bacterium]
MWAMIGGSGFENFSDFEIIEELNRETPYGLASSGFKKVKLGGQELLFLSRHGAHHELLPSEVNYRANIWALKNYGASRILSISAVGSLKKEFKPGDMVLVDQYIDRTKSIRAHSYCGEGVVGHVSLAKPTNKTVQEAIYSLRDKMNFDIHLGGTYICIEGPTFSTQAESLSYVQRGANIIGMTNFPEYALAREAGIWYVPMSFVTDYDCWDDSIPHVTLEQVIDTMRKNNQKAFDIAKATLESFPDLGKEGCSDQGLKTGLMTPADAIPSKWKEAVEVLQK